MPPLNLPTNRSIPKLSVQKYSNFYQIQKGSPDLILVEQSKVHQVHAKYLDWINNTDFADLRWATKKRKDFHQIKGNLVENI